MAIHPSGRFSYSGKLTEESFERDEIVIQIRCEDPPEEKRLVGHEPKIRFWNQRLILDATNENDSFVATAAYSIGDAVQRIVQPGDSLSVNRNWAGDLSLGVSRGEKWLVGLGAVGTDFMFSDVTIRGAALRIGVPPEVEDDPSCDWIEFEADNQTVRLHERDSAEIAGYYIYVESVYKDGFPGEAECLAVTSLEDRRIRNAAIRSTVLLAGGEVQLVDW